MKQDRDISKRMRDMLTRDSIPIREGFVTAMKSDLEKLLPAYFELSSPISVCIDRAQDGDGYSVCVTFSASDINRFDTTLDIKRF